MDRAGFERLLHELAEGWATRDASRAAACFTDDAVYMEPPDQQLFVGREQLTAYFGPLEAGTYLRVHRVWFDAATQTGAVEFSFGVKGRERADHGVAVVEVRGERIALWREYPRKGPADFGEFVATEAKDWAWHIGNYP
jgi:uncharacterized protein (TIGR02246 family)